MQTDENKVTAASLAAKAARLKAAGKDRVSVADMLLTRPEDPQPAPDTGAGDTDSRPEYKAAAVANAAPRRAVGKIELGALVHYILDDGTERHNVGMIAHVWDEVSGTVNLGGFDHNGGPFVACAVRQGKDDEPNTWHFPE